MATSSRLDMATDISTFQQVSLRRAIPYGAVGSVVVPACNEASVVARGLDLLFDSLGADIEVVVACNGCTDGTADAVRRTGHAVRVIELDVASKARALRVADRAATAFPRVYLDADVLVSGATIRAVVRHLGRPGALAARPPLAYDTSACSWVVRRFYRARVRLPAVMGSLWGAGLYALSAEGHARLGVFPHVVADDLFVDRLFRPEEIDIVAADPVVVVAPATTAGLLASLRRVVRGNRSLRGLLADGRPGTAGTARDLLRLARRGPTELVDAAVYASMVVAARVLARRRVRAPRWERDETTRR
jgi:glycosyltransferase involved in cell wall biosynthesis